MERELKFRAWHRADELMYWWDVLWGNHGHGNGYIGMVLWGEKQTKHGIQRDKMRLIDPYDCEIMQFTGLYDKNGKEIYEGDICQAKQGEQQKPESFYVVKSNVTFWKGSFEFFGKSLNNVNTDDNGYSKNIMWCWHGHNNLPDIYEEINSIEVIGNIYGNIYESPQEIK